MNKNDTTQHTVTPHRKRGQGGFSMIELMVVIVVLGMLAALVSVNVFQNLSTAEVNTAKTQIKNLETALASYRLEFKKFPTSGEGLNALVSNSKNKNFLNSNDVPNDPWGNAFVYKQPGPNGAKYEIMSYGSDGAPGGTDDAADISSTNLQGDS